VHVLDLDERRNKLDGKCKKLMFVSYSHQHKAYRLLDVTTIKITISCGVIMDEKTTNFQLGSI